jgi:hypothetical protein
MTCHFKWKLRTIDLFSISPGISYLISQMKKPQRMSNTGQVETDWTQYFNKRFGSGITRRNVSIYTPIVQDFTAPLKRYNNGTVNPPDVVKRWEAPKSSFEPLIHDDIPSVTTSKTPYLGLDTNPNYKGDGMYFPDYQQHGVYYTYPQWTPGISTRGQVPQQKRDFPVEIRRRLQP